LKWFQYAIQTEINGLGGHLQGLAEWDLMYEYPRTGNERFQFRYLQIEDVRSSTNIDLVAVYDRDGKHGCGEMHMFPRSSHNKGYGIISAGRGRREDQRTKTA
jgi:hypothetical protein